MKAGLFAGALAALSLLATEPVYADGPLARADVRTLMQAALADDVARDRDVIVDLVLIPPNTTLDRHWHPGEEFQYYLEGEVTMEVEGQPPFLGKPGAVGHIPYRKLHTAKTGTSGAKILVFRVHAKGEPMRYLEGEKPAGTR